MSTPKPEPPGFTERDTTPKQIALVPATDAVGKSALFKRIRELRQEWCDLDIQLEKEKDPETRKKLEESMAKVIEKLKPLQSDTYTTGRMKPTCDTAKSAVLGKGRRRLQTRRRKHRNGSTRIQRHRPSRVSRRKRQTRRA